MRPKSLLPLWGVLLIAQGAPAQEPAELSLEDVLQRHYDAVGGLEAIKAVESTRATGKMIMGQGMEAPFTMIAKRPGKVRIEFTFQGMTGIQAFDGETAWMVMPFMGKTEPEVMPAEQAKEIQEQADLDGPLVDWQEKGHQVELVGKVEVEGTSAYKLKVTRKSGDVQYFYLDAEYFLPIKVEGKRMFQGAELEYETTISDYKEVGDLVLAHSITNQAKGIPGGQTISIEKIELNVEVGEESFHLPKGPKGQEGETPPPSN